LGRAGAGASYRIARAEGARFVKLGKLHFLP